jgi:hypothetical protein
LVLIALRSRGLSASIALVVQITRRASGSNARNRVHVSQPPATPGNHWQLLRLLLLKRVVRNQRLISCGGGGDRLQIVDRLAYCRRGR